MAAEDDFHRWERELDPGAPDHDPPQPRGMLTAAAITAAACTAVIALGDVPLGVAGLAISSIILLLWRLGL